jgi:SAM-dependent methyltransferase
LAAIFDPTTFRHIDDLGIGPGWRCWEVGAGGPSVVRWLADRVAPAGRVLATDIDVSRLAGVATSSIEIRKHDVARDPPPAGDFDLVHARLVLVHVEDRDRALESMVRALRPGGWLLVEDADPALQPLSCLDPQSDEEDLANRVRSTFRALMSARGVDLAFGRRLPRLLRQAGLVDVAADAHLTLVHPQCATLEATTIELIRDGLIAQGGLSAQEVDRHLSNVGSGRVDLAQPPLISAWGRLPSQ